MRAFLLDHATALPIPCHPAEGFGASLTLHVSLLLLLAAPASAPEISPSRGAVTFVTDVPPGMVEQADPSDPPAVSEIPVEGPASPRSISDFAVVLPDFEFDISKVGNSTELFPFLTDRLAFLDEARERFRQRPDRLVNPFGPERTRSDRPPLAATDAELQHLVDRAWSRRDRWSNFAEIAQLLTAHDPQEGAAHVLMRRYLDQNLLQPYYDATTRDPRFWVMLGLAADHTRLVGFVGSFVRQHPSSRTTTELLFMLDEFVQASRDTLLMLLSTDPYVALNDTRNASLPAFQIALQVYRRYKNLATELGLQDTGSVRTFFDEIRLRILKTIIETTPDGYGASDARFLAGRVMWEQNSIGAAWEWWNDLRPDGRGAYSAAVTEVGREVAFRDGQSAAEISRILGAEYRRWLDFSERRLEQFGYQFDTF